MRKRILSRNGRIEHIHAGHGRDGRVGAKRLVHAARKVGSKGPHDAAALRAQIALRAARIQRDVAGLRGRENAQLAQAVDVAGQQVLQMLQRVSTLRGRAKAAASLFKDVQRLMDGAIADGMDAHGVPALGSGEHHGAHLLRRHGKAPAVAREMRVGIRIGKVGGVLAGHAVEELLEARSSQKGALAVAILHSLQAGLVV